MKDNVIVCPKCGYEYTPSEIYISDYFLGKPTFIRRNVNGEIQDLVGIKPDLTELYKCDNCNTSFNIKATITYETNIDVGTDFDNCYETKLDK